MNLRRSFLAVIIGCSLSLTGCLRHALMKPTVQSFSAIDQFDSSKQLMVVPYNGKQASSLEWKTYATKIEARLIKPGYQITHEANMAQLVAYFGYAIDQGKEVLTTYAIPQYGMTGYNSARTTGTIATIGNFASYNATTTLQPSYGVTGYIPGTRRNVVFTRSLGIDIIDVASNQKKWEIGRSLNLPAET